jgi:hypothetical protein
MSNEHLWPKWVRQLLPPGVADEQVNYLFTDSERGETRRIKLRMFDLTVKDVCKPCNEGWMEDLESGARHFASGMIEGRGRVLHTGGQTALAAWAALKVLVCQRSFPGPLSPIPDDHYAAVYDAGRRGKSPDGVLVFTAKVPWHDREFKPPGHYRVIALGPGRDDRIHAHLATLTVLDLVVQVLFGETGIRAANHPRPIAGSVRRIWPTTDSFTWPPGPPLTEKGLRLAAGGEVGKTDYTIWPSQ